MASLKDKIIETAVDLGNRAVKPLTDLMHSAIASAVEGGIRSRYPEAMNTLGPMLDQYLKNPNLPASVRKQLEVIKGGTSIWDMLLWPVIALFGMLQGLMAAGRPWALVVEQAAWRDLPATKPEYPMAIAAYLRGAYTVEQFTDVMASWGYDSEARSALITALQKLLEDDDIRDLYLRGELRLDQAAKKLMAKGYSQEDVQALQKLYWRIPGVQDIIRMAVRETFTPEIAEKFGQYQDLPAEFVSWAAKQGLNEFWARNYWAAHWDLPSPTQGFDMFHRGIIDEDTLKMLLRALDVMPFWRDKLIGIAYSIPTRVDIRRMYKLGVYTREDVKNTYIKAGYHPDDAEDITEFVIRYYGEDEETDLDRDLDYTKSEILDGYRKRLITEDEARELLRALDWKDDQIDFYLDREDLKKDQSLKDAYLSRYRTLFIEGIMAADRVQEELEVVGVSKAEFEAVLPLWQIEKITRVNRPTRAQLDGFLQDGIITWPTWEAEYQLMGYSAEYISWYRASLEAKIGGAT